MSLSEERDEATALMASLERNEFLEKELNRLHRLQAGRENHRREADKLHSRIKELELELDAWHTLSSQQSKPIVITPSSGKGVNEATALLVASDWHIEESVEAELVNGRNFYDLDESQARATRFFERGLRLVDICRRDVAIPHVVLGVLGDMISGSIHPDLAESNLLPPIDAAIRCAGYLTGGLEYWLKSLRRSGTKIHVVCHTGNHGRITPERRIHTEAGNSLERMMYALVARHFANREGIDFTIARAYHTYMPVYGERVRWHHGHAIRYQGGVGGLFVPAFRSCDRWNRTREPATLDIFGHHHWRLDGGTFLSNGSLVGYSPFSVQGGYPYQEPEQIFTLIDKKRGRTTVWPIFVKKGD